MGGGRSGLFPGTKGAAPYQLSLFSEPIKVRRRGVTFISNEGIPGGEAVSGGEHKAIGKLHFLTVKEILKKCMEYRLEAISESQFIDWLRRVLKSKQYYIEANLRAILINALIRLEGTKTAKTTYNKKSFLIEIEELETKISFK